MAFAGFLVFSSLHIVIGEQGAEDARDPPADAGLAVDRLSALSRPIRVLPAELASQQRLTRDPAPARRRECLAARNSHHSEIEGLVEKSAVHGGIESGEANISTTSLRFGDLAVSDVMVHRTAMMLINTDLRRTAVVRAVMASRIHPHPVVARKPENIIGVLHAKDLLRAIRAAEGEPHTSTCQPSCCRPGSCRRCAAVRTVAAFRRRKTHFALVGRRVWRGRGHGDAGRHSGGNRRRYFR